VPIEVSGVTIFHYAEQVKFPAISFPLVPFNKLVVAQPLPAKGPAGKMLSTVAITPVSFGQAAADVGYALNTPWVNVLLAGPPAVSALSQYLALRLQSVVASVTFVGPGDVVSSSFIRWLESSDMGQLSYLYGQIAARLAADEWLGKSSQMAFLHKSVYANAALVSKPLTVSPTADPDYLVSTKPGLWHVFEAKGGQHQASQIRKGLSQIIRTTFVTDGVPGASTVPVSRVVVSVKILKLALPQQPWKVRVVSIPPASIAAALSSSVSSGADAVNGGGAAGDGENLDISIDADIAGLTVGAVQWAVLANLPSDQGETSLMVRKDSLESARHIGSDGAFVWLPEKTHIDAYFYELMVFYQLRAWLGANGRQVLTKAHVEEITNSAVRLCDFEVDTARREEANAALLQDDGVDVLENRLERACIHLKLRERHKALKDLSEASLGIVRARLRQRRLARNNIAPQPELRATQCGAVVYAPI
jgi:hypothetical protein